MFKNKDGSYNLFSILLSGLIILSIITTSYFYFEEDIQNFTSSIEFPDIEVDEPEIIYTDMNVTPSPIDPIVESVYTGVNITPPSIIPIVETTPITDSNLPPINLSFGDDSYTWVNNTTSTNVQTPSITANNNSTFTVDKFDATLLLMQETVGTSFNLISIMAMIFGMWYIIGMFGRVFR